ncbi:MAG: phosphodiester glycosidase family protein [Christensenella sp.]|nr:phosphodiester glycosidase family protein [Christensenella sp.]
MKKRSSQWSGPHLIVRDLLVFTLSLLAIVLVQLLSHQAPAAVVQNDRSTSASAANTPQTDTGSAAAVSQSPQSGSEAQSAVQQAQAEPSSTPEPTPSPTPDTPAAHGDFSATFPTTDTGAGALYSHQSDTARISINRVQENGVTYFVADVWVKTIDAFHTALAKGSYGRSIHEMPLKIANDNQAVFAVSGDYYGAREQGVVVRNGALYRDVMGEDVCILKKDGTLSVYKKSEFNALGMLNDSVWQAWAFGPALVNNGTACDTSDSKIKVKNPRCAIGYYAPGHYCFIVVDGRQSGYSDGMTLDELAQTFVSLGCVTAYNLDGGATAMMVFQGAVISQPTSGGRSSSDIIYF